MKTTILFLSAFFLIVHMYSQGLSGNAPLKTYMLPDITWAEVTNKSGSQFIVNSQGHIFAGQWGVMRSVDNGITWTDEVTLPNDPSEVRSMAINSQDVIFLTTYDDNLFRSTDNGATWTQLFADSTHIDFICVDVNSADVLYIATDYGVLRSIDNGESIEHTGYNYYEIEDMIITPDNVIIVSSVYGYRSTDDGDTWEQIDSDAPRTVNDFALNSSGHVLSGSASGVDISTDNGVTWTNAGYSRLDEVDSVVTAVACNASNDIFIGTFGIGILYMSSSGDDLKSINTGIPTTHGYQIISDFCFTHDGYILAGTSAGIYRSQQVVTAVTGSHDYLSALTLSIQNHPNPFHRTTTITYSIPERTHINISIYDLCGRKVETLVNQIHQSGRYEITWDASHVGPGTYFYRMQTGEHSSIKKMIVIE